jgi:hypothetical protein
MNIYIYIYSDLKVAAPWGRIPDPQDIFGSVLLKEGVIVLGSYERMPSHRVVSSAGLFELPSEFLMSRFVSFLRIEN